MAKEEKKYDRGSSGVHSIVGEGTIFEGNISVQGSLRIDGIFKGTIKCDAFYVGRSAEVTAEIEANRSPAKKQAHQDIYVAIRDSFNAARRQLQDLARKRQGNVKTHEVPPHGHVVRLFADDGYGFIESADGRELYFHANSVVEGFERLEVGSEVRFAEEMGEKGAQATTVHLIGKHHLP